MQNSGNAVIGRIIGNHEEKMITAFAKNIDCATNNKAEFGP